MERLALSHPEYTLPPVFTGRLPPSPAAPQDLYQQWRGRLGHGTLPDPILEGRRVEHAMGAKNDEHESMQEFIRQTPQYQPTEEEAYMERLSVASLNPRYAQWFRLQRQAEREKETRQEDKGPFPFERSSGIMAPVDWCNVPLMTGTYHQKGFIMDKQAQQRMVTREMLEGIGKGPEPIIPSVVPRKSSRESYTMRQVEELPSRF